MLSRRHLVAPALVSLLSFAALVVACGDEETAAPITPAVGGSAGKAGNPADTAAGAGGDESPAGNGGTSGEAGQAGSGGATDTVPQPSIGKIPGTADFVKAPAQCGQAAYTILDDAKLGEVVDFGSAKTFTADTLQALVESQGITVPRPLKYDVNVAVVTYTTQDRGKLIEATAAIARPNNVPADAAPLPVLALLHGTSGFRDGCGVSKELEYQGLASALASLGFVVVVPDYLGLKASGTPTGFPHPYLGGIPTAIASLDAIRAAYRLPDDLIEGGARLSTDVVIVGGSQGGHAALWVDRFAPYYAGEFTLRGIVATVPPADLVTESTLALTTLRDSSANTIAVMSTLPAWYGAESHIGEWLKEPFATQAPEILAAACEPTDEQKALLENYKSLDDAFQPALLDAAKAGEIADFPVLGCLIRENGLTSTSLPRKTPARDDFGILWVLGEKDTLVDTPTERVSYGTLCNAGMPLQFLECQGASHTAATTWALPEIVGFLFDRLDGKAFAPSCAVTPATRCQGTPADK
jgi:hypothetical protein